MVIEPADNPVSSSGAKAKTGKKGGKGNESGKAATLPGGAASAAARAAVADATNSASSAAEASAPGTEGANPEGGEQSKTGTGEMKTKESAKPESLNFFAPSPPSSGSAEPPTSQDKAPLSAILDDIDSGFDAIVSGGGGESTASSEELGASDEVRALFRQIAAAHVGPVRDLMIELALGDPPKAWLDVCLPALNTLKRGAEDTGLPDLAQAIDGFVAVLQDADSAEGATIGGELRVRIVHAYHELERVAPEAFELNDEGDRREPIIVRSLLLQVPGLRRVALDKIYSAGVTKLEQFFTASPTELSQATGISHGLAEGVVARFASHRDEVAAIAPDRDRSAEVAQLAELADQLDSLNEAYDDASGADRRKARRERDEAMLQVEVVLARLGEVERVEQLARATFRQKAKDLRRFVEEARQGAGGA